MKAMLIAAAAAAAMLATPAAASAEERVRLSDLELGQQSDISRLDHRIDRAARRLCAASESDPAANRACRQAAVRRVAGQRQALIARAFNGRALGMTELVLN
ncbi:MAG TPA: UrcA family protein [Allosphingosinicella sp.]